MTNNTSSNTTRKASFFYKIEYLFYLIISSLFCKLFIYQDNICIYLSFMTLIILSLFDYIINDLYKRKSLIVLKKSTVFFLFTFSISAIWCFLPILPKKELTGLYICLFFLIIFYYLLIKQKENLMPNVFKICQPLYVFFVIEYFQKRVSYFLGMTILSSSRTFNEVNPYHAIFLMTLVFILGFNGIFFIFTKKEKLAYIISSSILFTLGIINFFVLILTEQPFVIANVFSAKTALNVIHSQKLLPKDWLWFAGGVAFIIIYYILLNICFNKSTAKAKRRTGKAILSCILIVWISFAWFSSFSETLQFAAHYNDGFIYNFVVNLNYKIKIPKESNSLKLDTKEKIKYTKVSEKNPNIIFVMGEAYSDLEKTYGVKLSEDSMKYFHKLEKNYPSGISYSSVYGNNTVSSEWESVSGVSTGLTIKGAINYQQNCKPMYSLVDVFNQRNYYTLGLHPGESNGYNRKNMYNNLGFKKSVFKEDFHYVKKYREYITDEQNFKELIKLYNSHGSSPFFCLNVTIQNHAGYNDKNVFKKYIKLNTKKQYKDLELYETLMSKTDNGIEYLTNYFSKVKEPTIILFFGDHQPIGASSLCKKNISDKEQQKQIHEIPYVIWSNYDLPNKKAAENKVTSINYLPLLVFKAADIKSNQWIDKLNVYYNNYPVVTENFCIDKNGKYYNTKFLIEKFKKNKTTKLSKYLYDYRLYSYKILSGCNLKCKS